MNPDDPRLESQIDRLLRGLPELDAPEGLAARTLAAIERRAAPARQMQPWPMWPVAWRAASLCAMLGAFGALCAAHWQLWHSAWIAQMAQSVSQRLAGFGFVADVAQTLWGAVAAVAAPWSTTLAVAGLVVVTAAYLSCIAAATAAVRFARRRY